MKPLGGSRYAGLGAEVGYHDIGERAYCLEIIFGMSCVATLLLTLGLAKTKKRRKFLPIVLFQRLRAMFLHNSFSHKRFVQKETSLKETSLLYANFGF